MVTRSKANAPLDAAILDMAEDAHAGGVMDGATLQTITIREIAQLPGTALAPLNGEDIRAMREQAQLSQAVFAQYLNLTTGYISQLERGAKQPSGPALVLLNLIRRHGMQAIL